MFNFDISLPLNMFQRWTCCNGEYVSTSTFKKKVEVLILVFFPLWEIQFMNSENFPKSLQD